MVQLGQYPPVYGFWNNKGGVGKTTLAFHVATSYAELFPEKAVLCIDMCPQANLSATLLTKTTANDFVDGADVVKRHAGEAGPTERDITFDPERPKTVAGYLSCCIDQVYGAEAIPVARWLVDLPSFNPHLPRNMHLLCGDSLLDTLARELHAMAAGEFASRAVHNSIRRFIQAASDHFAEKKRELVVFVDASSSMSIYTAIALTAMTQLITPTSADDFSLQGVRNVLHLVHGLYPRVKGRAALHEENTFAAKAKRAGLNLPAITCLVHNRCHVNKDLQPAEEGGPTFVTAKAYAEMVKEQAKQLFDGYHTAALKEDKAVLPRVFQIGPNQHVLRQNQFLLFKERYTCMMRDMGSCGLAAMKTGLPLFKLLRHTNLLPTELQGPDYGKTVPKLVKDMLHLMDTIFRADMDTDNADSSGTDVDALQRVKAQAGLVAPED